MSIFSYTSTHGMMKKTPLDDHDDHLRNGDGDADGIDSDHDDQSVMILIWRIIPNMVKMKVPHGHTKSISMTVVMKMMVMMTIIMATTMTMTKNI